VYKVLPSPLKLYKEVIQLSKNIALDKIAKDPKRCPYFTNYIRAFNGTYIPISIKSGYIK